MARKITLHFMKADHQCKHITSNCMFETRQNSPGFISYRYLLQRRPCSSIQKKMYSLIQYNPKIPPYIKTCLILSIVQMYRNLYSFSFLRLRLWRRFAGPASKLDHGREAIMNNRESLGRGWGKDLARKRLGNKDFCWKGK